MQFIFILVWTCLCQESSGKFCRTGDQSELSAHVHARLCVRVCAAQVCLFPAEHSNGSDLPDRVIGTKCVPGGCSDGNARKISEL